MNIILLCVLDINDCTPNPCVHGDCTDGIDDYYCTCDPGYNGTNCETSKNLHNPPLS